MAFPAPTEQFPPRRWAPAFEVYERNAAWMNGDTERLTQLYAADAPRKTISRVDRRGRSYTGGLFPRIASSFMGRPAVTESGSRMTRLALPIAPNLCTLSADMLMSEPPVFRLMAADGETVKGGSQDALDAILNSRRTRMALIQGAETVAGLGAAVLTAHWDTATSDEPWMQVTNADAAVPEWRAGRLEAVTLFTRLEKVGRGGNIEATFLHLERHERGAVVHALAKMRDDVIEQFVPLTTMEETAHILDIPGGVYDTRKGANVVVLPTGTDLLTASWWRNQPTRLFAGSAGLDMLGRGDYEGPQGEGLLDAANEIWSSWLRDIRVGRAMMTIPESYAQSGGLGLGGKIDLDQEVFVTLGTVNPNSRNDITSNQFAIRAPEHAATYSAMLREITQNAGWSVSTYGEGQVAAAQTATEVVDRTTMSERTRDRKFLYFAHAAGPLAEVLLELNRIHYRGPGMIDAEVDIAIPPVSQVDPEKQARTMQHLRTAYAISTDTMVRGLHPEWDNEQIAEEVVRILRENPQLSGVQEQEPATLGRSENPLDAVDPLDEDEDQPDGQAA